MFYAFRSKSREQLTFQSSCWSNGFSFTFSGSDYVYCKCVNVVQINYWTNTVVFSSLIWNLHFTARSSQRQKNIVHSKIRNTMTAVIIKVRGLAVNYDDGNDNYFDQWYQHTFQSYLYRIFDQWANLKWCDTYLWLEVALRPISQALSTTRGDILL